MLLVLHVIATFTVAVPVQSFKMCSAARNMQTVGIGSRLLMLAPAGARDGMLRWFEEYARRLQEGVYGVSLQPRTHMDLGVPPTLAIDLYPLKPPVRLLHFLLSFTSSRPRVTGAHQPCAAAGSRQHPCSNSLVYTCCF